MYHYYICWICIIIISAGHVSLLYLLDMYHYYICWTCIIIISAGHVSYFCWTCIIIISAGHVSLLYLQDMYHISAGHVSSITPGPADLTVHPPPQNCREMGSFFSYRCLVFPTKCPQRKACAFRIY